MYYPGVYAIQECALSGSMYYPGVCTNQECVLSRSVYYPGVCTIQECVLSRSVYYPGVCTISRSVYYPGVCTIQEYVLSRSVYYPRYLPNFIVSEVCLLPIGVAFSTVHEVGREGKRTLTNDEYVVYAMCFHNHANSTVLLTFICPSSYSELKFFEVWRTARSTTLGEAAYAANTCFDKDQLVTGLEYQMTLYVVWED